MATLQTTSDKPSRRASWLRRFGIGLGIFLLLLLAVGIAARIWLRHAMHDALPQIDGTAQVHGLTQTVHVTRDDHGIPHITAHSLHDLAFAQGYVTAQDRLWQMDVLRRHASGQLAELLGSNLLPHDKLQRTLSLRAAAEGALPALPADQRALLEAYADGVNAFVAAHGNTLPAEFRVLRYQPAPWTAVDCLLVGYAMAQDLSTNFQDKLNREAVGAHLSPELMADLYPVGSWRDHPPVEAAASAPTVPHRPQAHTKDDDEDVSQARLQLHDEALQQINQTLAAFVSHYRCDDCAAGSNNWVVAGSHTANGHPLLANDMHLALNLPGIWYQADLEADNFHATGVTLPGLPFVIVGHNQHIAWGFTNSGADVQDVYVETVQGEKYQDASGAWKPLQHRTEIIHVRGGRDVQLNIVFTDHRGIPTPLITPLLRNEKRPLALLWSIYDPANASIPFHRVNAAANWNEFLAAWHDFGAPSQNVVYADDQGHIGYHMVGRVPVRGDAANPAGLSPVPVPTGSYEWSGYLPFEDLPQSYDPPGGILATANARITSDDYKHHITLDWEAPYRNERIWKQLAARPKLTQQDMLALENDVYSDFDHVLAKHLVYAIDHAGNSDKTTVQAADVLRKWDGVVAINSVAPNIVNAAKSALWSMLLQPKLGSAARLYTWRSRTFVLEDLVQHQPARWLPQEYPSWNELLTAAVERGLHDADAPRDLSTWIWEKTNTVQLSHPIFGMTPTLRRMIGMNTSSRSYSIPGDGTTVRPGLKTHGASERFVIDPTDPEHAWMNIVSGESGNPASPWYLDQFEMWVHGTTMLLPFSNTQAAHTLVLTP